MTKAIRKAFDLGIAATSAVVILGFAASSIGFGQADAQEIEQPQIFQVASFAQ